MAFACIFYKNIFPRAYNIAVSQKCNLACTHCYRTIYNYSSKNKNIDFELFKTIIDQIKPYHFFFKTKKPTISLHGLGEPTLNKNLLSIIAYCNHSQKFSSIEMASNLLAVDIKKYEGYFENGLSDMQISIDSLKKENVMKTRVGTNIALFKKNLEYIVKKFPTKITIVTVASQTNENEFDDLFYYLKNIGVRFWILQPLISFDSHSKSSTGYSSIKIEALKNKFKSLNKKNDMMISFNNYSGSYGCKMPMETMFIDSLGKVLLCCAQINSDKLFFGDSNQSDIYKLFNSMEFNSFRSNFFNDQPQICSRCFMSWRKNKLLYFAVRIKKAMSKLSHLASFE